jgi:hypothetical protein
MTVKELIKIIKVLKGDYTIRIDDGDSGLDLVKIEIDTEHEQILLKSY